MLLTIRCQNCRLEKPANPRLKGEQKFCSDEACQRERKRLWQRENLSAHPCYRAHQRTALKLWRRKRPLHRYQKEYRDHHPEYVQKNREQQRLRNYQRRLQNTSVAGEKIVKMDAFSYHPVKSGTYLLTPCSLEASAKIVKMDALLVALQVFQGDNAFPGAAAA